MDGENLMILSLLDTIKVEYARERSMTQAIYPENIANIYIFNNSVINSIMSIIKRIN